MLTLTYADSLAGSFRLNALLTADAAFYSSDPGSTKVPEASSLMI